MTHHHQAPLHAQPLTALTALFVLHKKDSLPGLFLFKIPRAACTWTLLDEQLLLLASTTPVLLNNAAAAGVLGNGTTGYALFSATPVLGDGALFLFS
jgi:hypothetical protein